MRFTECMFEGGVPQFINDDEEERNPDCFFYRCTLIGIAEKDLPAIWQCEECTVVDEEIGVFNWGFTLN